MKNNTYSTLLNIIAICIAGMLLLIALIALIVSGVTSGILFFISAILISPLIKIFLNSSKGILRSIRILGGVFFFILGIIFWQDGVEVKADVTKVANQRKDSINQLLKPKELSVCEVIQDISELETATIKEADLKFPNYGSDHNTYVTKVSESKTKEYLKLNHIKDSLYNEILTFVMECTDEERKQRQREIRWQKQQTKELKKKKEKCLQASCSLISNRIKNSLDNPKSFEKVSCEQINFKDGVMTIQITYRGENAFGAIRTEKQAFNIDVDNCSIL